MRLHCISCSKVSLIEEINKYSTADAHNLSSNIQKIQEELKKLKDRATCNLQSLEKAYDRIKEEIETVRRKINKELDRLEKVTLLEVENLISSSKILITKERDECDSIHKNLQCHSEADNDVCNKSSTLLFIALEKCQQQINDSELFVEEWKVTNDYGWDFEPNNNIEKFISNLTGLGKISKTNTVISLQKMSEYGVKIKSDLHPCSIYAICELPSREPLVLDYNYDKEKLFDKLLSNCKVLRYSYAMCLISPNELIVTTNEHDDLHFLQMITVRNDKLEKGNKIQLPHRCVGIARHEGDLYVTSGTALYQYTRTGTLVKKLYEDTTGDNTGSGHILFYYSNYYSNV
ncbi:hypothetical protein DPMN_184437 [Dreissena polymorpha]|uniref:Uncharacterized protein n=1 Tax=Dreissena polymorpha TaxID=45954 RepID=A0A9D4I7W0_DREPO|nr:hypothetical protein DPMN_184437 [Dreissena polymorpha]